MKPLTYSQLQSARSDIPITLYPMEMKWTRGLWSNKFLIFFTRFKINTSTHKTYPQHQDLLAGPWEEPREPEGNHERAVCTGLLQPWPPSSLWGHPSVQFHPVILYSICTLFLFINSPDVSLNLGTPLKRMGTAEVSPFPFSSTPILTWRSPLPPTKQCMKVVLTIFSMVHWNWLHTYYYFYASMTTIREVYNT